MRTLEVTVYKFAELPTSRAKDRALSWLRETHEYGWNAEERDSLTRFICDVSGRTVSRIEYATTTPDSSARDIVSTLDHSCVRGLTLADAQRMRDEIPTGYYADSTYRHVFCDEFERCGSAWKAFEHAISAGLRAWQADIEYQLSDEALIECCEVNEYEFDADGDTV